MSSARSCRLQGTFLVNLRNASVSPSARRYVGLPVSPSARPVHRTSRTQDGDSNSSSATATPSTATFDAVFTGMDVRIIKTGYKRQSERGRRALRRLDPPRTPPRLLIVNLRHAAAVLYAFERHYNGHRPHRSLGQAAPYRHSPAAPEPRSTTSDDTTSSAD